MSNELVKIKRALVSVTDKTHLELLAKTLTKYGVEIISSGGTGKHLEELGFKYTPVQEITGNPEAFGGRMKTLSFQISSSLLYRRGHDVDEKEAKELNIQPIDLVVCNLYPFEKASERNSDLDELVENIDIGGPTMIRSAAKNFNHVTTLTNPEQYHEFINELEENSGKTSLPFRKMSTLEAFKVMARYETQIVKTFEKELFTTEEKEKLGRDDEQTLLKHHAYISTDHGQELRYGENPHQKAMVIPLEKRTSLANVKPLQGKPLSYNNYLDSDAAVRCCHDLLKVQENEKWNQAVVIIKHSNPCGAAISSSLTHSLEKAWAADPISSFGSIIAFSHTVTIDEAEWLSDKFVEVIIAPGFTPDALNIFQKKKNLRVLSLDPSQVDMSCKMVRTIDGGVLLQEEDSILDREFEIVTQKTFPDSQAVVVKFGIATTKHFKSNAIALFKSDDDGLYLVGAGMGNPNRLVSTQQAVEKALENGHEDLHDAVLVSDAFFPFPDNVELAHEKGISFIVQPGGSIKDKDVINACDELGTSMIFTGRRHFRH